MPAARTSGLSKPKSKIRLRLGLTQSSPKVSVPTVSNTPQQPYQPSSINSNSSSLASSASHTTSSTANAPTESLTASTNTASSRFSRGDSRSAFALEISPSTASINHPDTAFDTVSYATASPTSACFEEDSHSSSTLGHREVYDLPSPSADEATQSEGEFERPVYYHNLENDATMAYTHPGIVRAAAAADDIFYISDGQLGSRFNFDKEIGYGNWGSVWVAKPRRGPLRADGREVKLGRRSASAGGMEAEGKVAVKLVHRQKCDTTAARVRALWGEMKIIRSLRHEPHPSIIAFEAFVITPSYALIIMPYHPELIPVELPPSRACPIFRQLASAIGYLHERGITHNDIKPANILLTYYDTPILIDFGFATKCEVNTRGAFLTTISWGTPEYLDPHRARGLPHDERASDVWSLGVTMFEILIGRTPFELDEDEIFETPDDFLIYYERAFRGEWIGDWDMPYDLEELLRAMISPDPAYRISAMQAYHHPSLRPTSPSVLITPHFVRAAASMEFDGQYVPLPVPTARDVEHGDKKKTKKKKKAVRGDKENRPLARAPTPALSESIKQHTSVSRTKRDPLSSRLGENVEPMPSPTKAVIKSKGLLVQPTRNREEDTTPTKMGKTAQSLRMQEMSTLAQKENKGSLRVSEAQAPTLSRAASANSLATNATIATLKAGADHRASGISIVSTSTVPVKTKEEAVLKTMRSLEGTRKIQRVKSRDVLGAIKRPAPSPPRPRSLDSQLEADTRKSKEEQRRSLGVERRLEDLQEESPARNEVPDAVRESAKQRTITSPPRKSPAKSVRVPSVASPPRPRINTRPTEVVKAGKPFPNGMWDEPASPLTELRQKILSIDNDNLERFRKVSGDLMVKRSSGTLGPEIDKGVVPGVKSSPVSEQDARLDKFALWVKDVERLVADTRKAIADGKDAPLPNITLPEELKGLSLPDFNLVPPTEASTEIKEDEGPVQQHRFGLTPEKAAAIPTHLRTSSTQVEPATPPKWLLDQEAAAELLKAEQAAKAVGTAKVEPGFQSRSDEKEARPNSMSKADLAVVKKGPKKERPTVSHVLKLFGQEKEKLPGRTQTPEPMTTIPLKSPGGGQTLRGAPSTPALRTTTVRTSKGLVRKSESNLRNFNTMPTLSAIMAEGQASSGISPRRAVYEDLLESTPGVSRQGDGWTSWTSPKGMAKTSSMASLREKALSFLRDDHRDSRDSRDMRESRQALRESKELANATTTAGGGRTERHIVDLAQEVEDQRERLRRGSKSDLKRPTTPGMNGLGRVNANGLGAGGEKKGLFGRLKGLVGKKGMERVDEA